MVTPAVDPEHRLPARLTSVLPVPREPGKFEVVFAVDIGEDQSAIKPGMACSVKFVPYRKEDALTVPSTAVFEDDSADALTYYVYLAKPDKDGKHPKRQVKIGKTAGGKTEIARRPRRRGRNPDQQAVSRPSRSARASRLGIRGLQSPERPSWSVPSRPRIQERFACSVRRSG